MTITAFTTYPGSLIQTRTPFRAGDTSAFGAGPRGKSLIHFFISGSGPNGLVSEHLAKCRPSGIVNRLSHLGLGEFLSIYIANSNVIEFISKPVREFVKMVSAAIGNFGVYVSGLTPLVGPLRLPEPFLKLSIVARILNNLSGGKCGEVFQSEIDTDLAGDLSTIRLTERYDYIQIPVAFRILREIRPVLNDGVTGDSSTAKYPKNLLVEPESTVNDFYVLRSEWHPAETSPASVSQIWLIALPSSSCVLPADGMNYGCWNSEFGADAASGVNQVKSGRPFLSPFDRVFLRIVAVIPHHVDRPGIAIQLAFQVLNSVSVGQNHEQIISQHPHLLTEGD